MRQRIINVWFGYIYSKLGKRTRGLTFLTDKDPLYIGGLLSMLYLTLIDFYALNKPLIRVGFPYRGKNPR